MSDMNDDLYNKLGGPANSNYDGRHTRRDRHIPLYLDHMAPDRVREAFEFSNEGTVTKLKPARARVVEE